MIMWHSIIFKIITSIENISELFKTHILYFYVFLKLVHVMGQSGSFVAPDRIENTRYT